HVQGLPATAIKAASRTPPPSCRSTTATFRCASNLRLCRTCCAWYLETVIRIAPGIDPDIASAAALIGDPSRATILMALAAGRALPAGELARLPRISPQTASAHLDKLFRGHLVVVEVQGRHHYYRLRDARVADVLEALSRVSSPAPVLTPAQHDRARTLRFA